ncbi:hypothetical protein, partial [Escherichia coli]|uniref:hypothetical protein n=1 Tax=Escherichia coli TaxID=562 RepID=UPI003D059B07
LFEECVDGMLRAAMGTPTDKCQEGIERIVRAFKDEEPMADHFGFIELCAETARRIIGKPTEEARARSFLTGKIPAASIMEVA